MPIFQTCLQILFTQQTCLEWMTYIRVEILMHGSNIKPIEFRLSSWRWKKKLMWVQASGALCEARGGDHPRRACCWGITTSRDQQIGFQMKLAGDPGVYPKIWMGVLWVCPNSWNECCKKTLKSMVWEVEFHLRGTKKITCADPVRLLASHPLPLGWQGPFGRSGDPRRPESSSACL